MHSKTTFYLLSSLLLVLFSAIVLFFSFARISSAAPTLGDASNKTTLGNDLIGNSKYVYNVAGLSIGTSATSSTRLVLGTGGSIQFPDSSTQTTAFTGVESVLASRVSSDVFGRLATKGNYTFEEATNTNVVFFVDATNARVGVKTNSPQVALDIAGAEYTRRVAVTETTGTTTINWINSNVQSVLLNLATTTLNFTNGQDGGKYTLILKQDATGGRDITWPSSVRWSGATPQITNGANKTDYFGFIYNGIDSKYDGVAVNKNF